MEQHLKCPNLLWSNESDTNEKSVGMQSERKAVK